MAEIEVEESYETTTVRRKTVKQSFKIEEVSNCSKTAADSCTGEIFRPWRQRAFIVALFLTKHIPR